MVHINQAFSAITEQLVSNSRQSQSVADDRLYQPANMENRRLIEKIMDKLVLPKSTILGFENMRELYDRSQKGESCLILSEHYSNFDIPALFYLAKEFEHGSEIMDSVVAMAGLKLNEESRFVLAFTEAYSRIVIYPARSLEELSDQHEYEAELRRGRQINRSALREMIRMKHSGHMILLFPAGTRFRPSKPDSKRILSQVDSYIRAFDHMVFVGIAGNTLEVHPSGGMSDDIPKQDVMVYNVSPVNACDDFRRSVRTNADQGGEAFKRVVADAVGARFDQLHQEAEAVRQERLSG